MINKPISFSVQYRNPGHWDIIIKDYGRIFRIRGAPSKYCVIDERERSIKKEIQRFKTVQACMSYICDELMFELIVTVGQEHIIIESWNL